MVVLIFASVVPNCDVCSFCLQSRFRGLRRIASIQRSSDFSEQVVPASEEDQAKEADLGRLMLLIPFIKRDAFERYLLIHHFVSTMSEIWGGFLLSTLIFSLLATGFTYYLLVISNSVGNNEPIFGFIIGLGVATVLFIWPVWCLAMANTGVNIISESFQLTAPDDYMLLGDRDTWQTFAEQAPLYWTILGVPITRSVLRAYYSTAGPALPLIMSLLYNAKNYLPKSE